MSAAWHRTWRPILGIAVLLIVVIGVDPAEIAERLSRSDLRLVIAGVLGLTGMHLVPAAGWRAIVRTISGVRLRWPAALSLYYASQAIGGITPANLGGDVHRAAALRRAGDTWSAAVAPLIVQRATSYLALSALALLGLAALAARTELAGAIVAAGVAFAVVVAAAAWLLLAPPTALRSMHARVVRLVTGSMARAGGVATPRLGTASAIGLAQGVAFHAGSIGLTALLVQAVDPGVEWATVVAALAVARLSLAVPFAPSGLGVQEGALALLFGAIGLPPEVALAGLLLARLSLIATTALGALLLMRPPSSMADGTVGGGLASAASPTRPGRPAS